MDKGKVSEAMELLKQENEERLQKCAAELNEVLQRHNCTLSPRVTITSEGTSFSFDLIVN